MVAYVEKAKRVGAGSRGGYEGGSHFVPQSSGLARFARALRCNLERRQYRCAGRPL